LFAAVLPLPYFYYMLLRLLVFAVALYYGYSKYSKGEKDKELYFYIIAAILFNPLIPVFLIKFLWMPIDIIVGWYFWKYSQPE